MSLAGAPIFITSSHELCSLGEPMMPAAEAMARKRARRAQMLAKLSSVVKQEDVKHTIELGLRELLSAGLIKPGTGNVTLAYKGSFFRADLQPSAHIQFEEHSFDSPVSFAAHFRKQQPRSGQPEDSGWASVHVDGASCEDLRHRLVSHKKAGQVEPFSAKSAAAPPQPQLTADGLPMLPSVLTANLPDEDEEAADGEAEAEADTANWVQCSRCETWRVVPDEFWPDIEAAGDDNEDWFCHEATWDVEQFEPGTPACK